MKILKNKLLWAGLFVLVALILAAGATLGTALIANRITDQQTVLIAPEILRPGRENLVRAIVRDVNSGAPLRSVAIVMQLAPRTGGAGLTLFEGQTDAAGLVEARVVVPEGMTGEHRFVVETRFQGKSEKLDRVVEVRRDHKLLLSTDKPLYQPGQTIHVRSLALAVGDMAPAAREKVEFIIEDPKGNKVYRNTLTTSAWGICSLDFDLASEVTTGAYKIAASLGETTSEKTVTVQPYVLPKFKIAVQTDKSFYMPGEMVKGSLQVDYFFGKPVSEGQVEIRGYVYPVRPREVVRIDGKTDAQGRFEFRFDLPAQFPTGALKEGRGIVGLEIAVVDQAEHAEQTVHALTVSEEAILIDAVPESALLKVGMENILYILAVYPDGSPAEAELSVRFGTQTTSLKAGRYGLAEFSFVPETREAVALWIEARDDHGNRASRMVTLSPTSAEEDILLRPERAAYRVGETMHVDVLSPAKRGTAYLDIVREGQTLSMRALEIRDGRAAADIDLDETLFGTLHLQAYKVLSTGDIIYDTRLVIVDRAEDIRLDVTVDRETYRPGDMARLSFQSSVGGEPIPAALGLSIVDESVFALQEQDAGFAKLYFLLQAELLEPKYQLKGFAPSGYVPQPGTAAEVQAARDRTTKAALAQIPAPSVQEVSGSIAEKQRTVAGERRAVYARTTTVLGWGILTICALGFVVSIVSFGRRLYQKRSLSDAALIVLALIGAGIMIAALGLEEWYMPPALWVVIPGPVVLWGLVTLGIHAWRRRYELLQITYLLLLGCLALMALAAFTVVRSMDADILSMDWTGKLIRPALAILVLLLGIGIQGIARSPEDEKGLDPVRVLAGWATMLPVVLVGLGFAYFMWWTWQYHWENVIIVEKEKIVKETVEVGREKVVTKVVEKEVIKVVEKEVTKVVEKVVAVTATPSAQKPPEEKPTAEVQEAPRLRQYFPETLYWDPQLLTDDSGRAEVEIPVADSITTWRLSVLASSQRGELGSASAGLRVFQDFFIDLDLPLYLTEGDEVSLPVAVYNYLPHEQQVRLEVKQDPWFDLLDEPEKSLTIASNDVEVVYFRIRAAKFGQQRFQVTGWGETMSDAIAKEVQVVPDGREFSLSTSGRLSGSLSETVLIPETAIPGTAKVWIKIYPGVTSQIVEGLDGLIKLPHG